MYICNLSIKTMVNPTNPEEFYNNLKEKLQDTSMWPTEYLYKFIIKSDPFQNQVN